jgi:hypothetical protein
MANPVIILPKGAAGSFTGEFSISGLRIAGQVTLITLNSTTWTKMERSGSTDPTGSGPLTDRNAICIQNQSEILCKLNYSDSVAGFKGIDIPAGTERHYDITENIDVYLKAESGTPVIALEEIA